ncbi:MAG: transposase [Rhodoferax sp.]|nr:transposase [Rhodoferax sp.]
MKSSNWTPGGGDAICNRVCLQRVLCGACTTPHHHRQYRVSCFTRPAGSRRPTRPSCRMRVRTRILRAFALRSLIESLEARGMLAYRYSGFSVHAGVFTQAKTRIGLERLLLFCARPPFALERCASWARSWSTAVPNHKAAANRPICCSRRWSESSASPPWCRQRARIATGTTECWRRTRRCGSR